VANVIKLNAFSRVRFSMSDYIIQPISSASLVPFKFDGRILFSSDNVELIHLTLQPGEGMDQHIQPLDVVFFVLEGTGSLLVGEDMLIITVNTTVYVKEGAYRSWTNNGPGPLRILVYKLIKQQALPG